MIHPVHIPDIPADSSDACLSHLLNSAVSQLNVVWDLPALVSLIRSTIPQPDRGRVSLELSSPPHRSQYLDYRLYSIPGRVFSVGVRGRGEANYYDLSQYFPDSPAPESLSDLTDYVSQLTDAISDLGIPSPTTLASPIALVSVGYLLSRYQTHIPTILDAPENLLDAYDVALRCTPREWVSNFQVGHFPQLYGYDIASAYPAHAAQLLDLRDCSFSRSDRLDLSAYYGFLVGDIYINPDHPYAFCSPFLTDRGDGTLVNFVGRQSAYPVTLDEVRALSCYDLGTFTPRVAWYIRPHNGVRLTWFPFKAMLEDLFSQRSRYSDLASYILKRVMNGLIGKMLEARRDADGNVTDYGALYNPIYHAICTSKTRLQVFDFLFTNLVTTDDLVHVGVDGVKLTRDLDYPASAPMGRWRSSGSEPTFVLSPGAVISPRRNFKRTGYSDFLGQLVSHPSAAKYSDGNIDLRNLHINQNRAFPRLPRTGQALLGNTYQSSPIEL